VRVLRAAGQQLTHALHQQSVAPERAHRQRQGALQQLVHGGLITAHRQAQVARVEVNGGVVRIEPGGTVEQHGVGLGVAWRGVRKLGAEQGHARVHVPAGQTVDVAQQRDCAELGHGAGIAVQVHRDAGHLAIHLHVQRGVGRQQAVVAAPALERHAQRGAGERGARQQAVAAPGQGSGKAAQAFVVELAHGGARDHFHLCRGNARTGFLELCWRYLCLLQRV